MGSCAASAGAACLEIELALAYVDGALSAVERDEVEQRIDRCAGCREVVSDAARRTGVDATPTVLERPAGGALRATPGRVGRYLVERELGSGGMGVVFLARDPELHRPVVIKLVHPDAFAEVGEAFELRLRREAQAMAQLSHPNVVQVFDLGRDGDRVFLAMELVSGMTLSRWLRTEPRTPRAVIAVFVQAARGLAAAHRAGLVHRDFKPSNVMVGDDGTVKVADFGLARSPGVAAADAPPRRSGVHAAITGHGGVVGTPAYMAPEQQAGRVDARADQYAFAVALIDALVGQQASARRIAPGAPADQLDAALARAGAGRAVRRAVARALQVEPEARFASMDELVAALVPARRRRVAWIAGAGAAAIAAAITAGVWSYAGCPVAGPARWSRARTAVTGALAGRAQPFAAWRAELVASALDRAVDALGIAERAACGGDGDSDCARRRVAALDHAIAALPGAGDPWPLVAAVARCDDDPTARALSALRSELQTAPALARAAAIAARAEAAGDLLLAVDAHDRLAQAALAAADVDAAQAAARTEVGLGERAGDDTARVRALATLVELARRRGDHAAAARDDDTLRAIVSRHPLPAADEAVVSAGEGAAFVALGDRVRGEAAWQRALAAARTAGNRDAALRARAALAAARYLLHDDARGALADGLAALRDAAHAGAATRAALGEALGEIALAVGDASTAAVAFAAAPDSLGAVRARALGGDVDGALAALDARTGRDDAAMVRIAIARAHVLHTAARDADAAGALRKAQGQLVTEPILHHRLWPQLGFEEHLDAAMLRCELERALGEAMACRDPERLVAGLAPQAFARVRAGLARADAERDRGHGYNEEVALEPVIAIAIDAQIAPLAIAELRWRFVQLRTYPNPRNRADALAARDAFAAAGKDTAAIDAWLAAHPAR